MEKKLALENLLNKLINYTGEKNIYNAMTNLDIHNEVHTLLSVLGLNIVNLDTTK